MAGNLSWRGEQNKSEIESRAKQSEKLAATCTHIVAYILPYILAYTVWYIYKGYGYRNNSDLKKGDLSTETVAYGVSE